MSLQHPPEEFSVTIRDECFPKSEIAELHLMLKARKLSVRDLIAERVRAELDNRLKGSNGQSAARLIEPGEKEMALNGDGARQAIDAEAHVKLAWSAFEKNGFVLLLNDRQVGDLDEEVEITGDTIVTFLKLTPLVGG